MVFSPVFPVPENDKTGGIGLKFGRKIHSQTTEYDRVEEKDHLRRVGGGAEEEDMLWGGDQKEHEGRRQNQSGRREEAGFHVAVAIKLSASGKSGKTKTHRRTEENGRRVDFKKRQRYVICYIKSIAVDSLM